MFCINLLAPFCIVAQGPDGYSNVTPEEALSALRADGGALALDVRTAAEFVGELGHVKGATLIPVEELSARVGELEAYKQKKIYIFCRSGHRSRTAGSLLAKAGFKKLFNVTTGMMGVNAVPGAPIER